jgi:hypothetical protein
MRFIVFGCKDDQLIEHTTNSFREATEWAKGNSDSGYRARIWDVLQQRFIQG